MIAEDYVIDTVMAFSIDPVLETYQRRTEKTHVRIQREERELKRFLALCVLYPDEQLPMFTFADDLWHEFICHTQLYHTFCDQLVGAYLHHEPFTSAHEPETAAQGEPTRRLYRRHFGNVPGYMSGAADCGTGHSGCSSCRSAPSKEEHSADYVESTAA